MPKLAVLYALLLLDSAWAEKRKFFTARAARTDCYRAGIHMYFVAGVCTKMRQFLHDTRQGTSIDALSLSLSGPANNILRMAVDGRVCMYFRPPGYSTEKGIYMLAVAIVGIIVITGWLQHDWYTNGLKSKPSLLCAFFL